MEHIWETGDVHTEFWWGNMRKSDHPEYLSIDGRIILKCNFKKLFGRVWTDLTQDRDRWKFDGKYAVEPSGSTKRGEFHD